MVHPLLKSYKRDYLPNHVLRHKHLSSLSHTRARLELEISRLNRRRAALQTLVDSTSVIRIHKRGQRYVHQWQLAPYGHPLPLQTKAQAAFAANYTDAVAYQLDGYGSDPECWTKTGRWSSHRARYQVPYIHHIGKRRCYVPTAPNPPQLDVDQELDLDHDTIRRYHH